MNHSKKSAVVGRSVSLPSKQTLKAIAELGPHVDALQLHFKNYTCPDNAAKILQQIKKHSIYVIIHGKLLYNFSNPDLSQTRYLFNELAFADQIGADVIIHQGKYLKASREDAIATFVDNLHEVLRQSDKAGHGNKIVLENSSHEGTSLGYTWQELAQIDALLDRPDRIGYCIDTAHGFAAGELDTRSADKVVSSLDRFDKLIGLNRVVVFHFNDSKKPWQSRVDAHENMLLGHISSPATTGPGGLKKLAQIANQHDIPLILETPFDDDSWSVEADMVRGWSQNNLTAEDTYRELLGDIIEIKGKDLTRSTSKPTSTRTKEQIKKQPPTSKQTTSKQTKKICIAIKKDGKTCAYRAKPKQVFCGIHVKKRTGSVS